MAQHGQRARRRAFDLKRFASTAIADGPRRQHRKRSQLRGEAAPSESAPELARLIEQHPARFRIAAVPRSIDEGPQPACRLNPLVATPEQPRAKAEQQIAPDPDRLTCLRSPREWVEQPQPPAFQIREVMSGNAARPKLAPDRLQPRLRRRFPALIELFQALAPPGKADR